MRAPCAGAAAASILFLLLAQGVAAPLPGQAASPDSARAPGAALTIADAVGYAGLGFGLALLGTWDMEGDGFGPPSAAVAIIGVGTLAGLLGGAVIGQRARRAIAAGDPLTPAHRTASLAGVALAGGALGALAAVPLINPSGEGTFLGSDERAVTLLTASGLALGSLYAWRLGPRLGPSAVRLTPEARGDGGFGLRLWLRLSAGSAP